MIQVGSLVGLITSYGKGENRAFTQTSIAKLDGRLSIKLGRFLKGLKIQMTIPGPDGKKQKRKIQELTKKSAKDSVFDCDGNKTNVAEYFKTHYRRTLQHPDWVSAPGFCDFATTYS